MIRINLLPHREIRRKQQQKEFFALLGAVIGLGAAAWFAVHSYLGGQLEEQDGRNSYLESEIAVLDKQIDEIKKLKEQTSALLQRKKIVESLQANRAETVYLLDQLVRQLPDGVYLKSVSQKVNTVTVNGYAQSNARVSTFMRNLESSPYLEKPVLIEIKALADKNSRLSEFSLSVLLTRSKEDQSPGKKPAAKPVAGAARVMPTTAKLARTMVLTAPADRPHELFPASSPAFSAATAPTVIVAANIEMSDRLVQLR
jgi:type IV pilus assembly protein PilN